MDDITTPSSVRRELNQKFYALPIFKGDRASALYHFCTAVELRKYPYAIVPDLVMSIMPMMMVAAVQAI